MAIQLIDFKTLDEHEGPLAQKLIVEYSKKLDRLFPGNTLIVKFKKYSKTGSRHKYSVHCRVDSPALIASAKASYWDLALTMHKALTKIHNELEHKFKLESQHKPFGKESRNKRHVR